MLSIPDCVPSFLSTTFAAAGKMDALDEGVSFHSYEEFQEALTKYCNKNYVQCTVTDRKKIQTENQKVTHQYDGQFQYRYLRFDCKNGPKNKKKKNKGHGIRPNQR